MFDRVAKHCVRPHPTSIQIGASPYRNEMAVVSLLVSCCLSFAQGGGGLPNII
ncbi:hypothetical protein C0J52_26452 [Blattella germanica]|nr:hypothetical protein C0J52_26452 [Blattella germanica]